MQNWYKNVFVDCNRAISTSLYADLNCSVKPWLHGIRTGAPCLLSTPPYSVSYRTNLHLWKPIDMKLDMCDANIQKHILYTYDTLCVHILPIMCTYFAAYDTQDAVRFSWVWRHLTKTDWVRFVLVIPIHLLICMKGRTTTFLIWKWHKLNVNN